MAIREILTYPNPLLRHEAKTVTRFDEELAELIHDMAATMYAAPGVGLAANQIGVLKQVVVMDIAPRDQPNELIVLINPEIMTREGEVVDEEGCLSVREYTAKVKRAQKIMVKAQDIKGNFREFEAEEWLARVIQHEVDHLRGILYIDYLSSLKRILYKKRLKKILFEEMEANEAEV